MNLDDILNEAEDTPPRTDGKPKTDTPPPRQQQAEPKRRRPPWAPKLEAQIADAYRAIGAGFAMTGDEFSSALIGSQAPALATAWVELAERDANVRKTLERLMSGSAWGSIVMMHIMIIFPILAHRDLIPGELGQRLKLMTMFMQETPDYPPNGNGTAT